MTDPTVPSSLLTRRRLVGGLALLPVMAATIRPAAATSAEDVFADPDVPVLGNRNGDVAIAMWFDYQCPFCKKVEPEMMEVVRADGKVAVLLKDWPIFGKMSETTARLTWSSRHQGKLEKVHRGLMAIEGRPTEARVDAVLASAGIDRARLDRDVAADEAAFRALTARNGAQAEGFGFPGTPAFVIGSFVFGGVLDKDGFRQAIADARAQKKKK
jgi:protein-disulfide isomerase